MHKVLSSSSRTVGERDRKRREREGRGGAGRKERGRSREALIIIQNSHPYAGVECSFMISQAYTLPLARVPLVMSTHAALAGEPWGLHLPSTPDQHVKTSFQTLRGAAEGWAGTHTLSRESVGPSIHLHLKLSVISMFI